MAGEDVRFIFELEGKGEGRRPTEPSVPRAEQVEPSQPVESPLSKILSARKSEKATVPPVPPTPPLRVDVPEEPAEPIRAASPERPATVRPEEPIRAASPERPATVRPEEPIRAASPERPATVRPAEPIRATPQPPSVPTKSIAKDVMSAASETVSKALEAEADNVLIGLQAYTRAQQKQQQALANERAKERTAEAVLHKAKLNEIKLQELGTEERLAAELEEFARFNKVRDQQNYIHTQKLAAMRAQQREENRIRREAEKAKPKVKVPVVSLMTPEELGERSAQRAKEREGRQEQVEVLRAQAEEDLASTKDLRDKQRAARRELRHLWADEFKSEKQEHKDRMANIRTNIHNEQERSDALREESERWANRQSELRKAAKQDQDELKATQTRQNEVRRAADAASKKETARNERDAKRRDAAAERARKQAETQEEKILRQQQFAIDHLFGWQNSRIIALQRAFPKMAGVLQAAGPFAAAGLSALRSAERPGTFATGMGIGGAVGAAVGKSLTDFLAAGGAERLSGQWAARAAVRTGTSVATGTAVATTAGAGGVSALLTRFAGPIGVLAGLYVGSRVGGGIARRMDQSINELRATAGRFSGEYMVAAAEGRVKALQQDLLLAERFGESMAAQKRADDYLARSTKALWAEVTDFATPLTTGASRVAGGAVDLLTLLVRGVNEIIRLMDATSGFDYEKAGDRGNVVAGGFFQVDVHHLYELRRKVPPGT